MQKISIITINYNNREGLIKTIDSVVSQTYSRVEYIIIDGGSIDGSPETIRDYDERGALKHLEHFCYVSEPDHGIYDAMNKGYLMSTGSYCLFLNSGDYLIKKDVLSCIFNDLDRTEDIIVGKQRHHNCFYFPCSRKLSKNQIDKFFFYCDTLPHQCSFISRSLLQRVGGYHTEFSVVSDWIFWFESFSKYDANISIINVYVSEQQPNGVSSNRDKCEMEINEYLSKNIHSISAAEWMQIREAFSRYFLYQKAISTSFGRLLVRMALLLNKFNLFHNR